jgi:hypothetical protein
MACSANRKNRMLRVPATTFVITRSPPQSKRRDGFDFSEERAAGRRSRSGWAAAARQFNTTPKTVAKWVERLRADGVDSFATAPKDPFHSQAKRRLRHAQPSRLCAARATSTLKSRSWVVLRKSATASLVTARPSNSRGVGWEYLYLAIDDHSLAAYEQAFVGLGACCAR